MIGAGCGLAIMVLPMRCMKLIGSTSERLIVRSSDREWDCFGAIHNVREKREKKELAWSLVFRVGAGVLR